MNYQPARIPEDPAEESKISRTPVESGPVLGQWYWVLCPGELDATGESSKWLGCATEIGSNYIKVSRPSDSNSPMSIRVHFDDFWTELLHEPDAEAIIKSYIAKHNLESQRLIAVVQELTQRLGMNPNPSIGHQAPSSEGMALIVLSSQNNPKDYARALVHAKEHQLPELFKAIKQEFVELARWMKAPSLPMHAAFDLSKTAISGIDDRIFTVGLYAGLVEEAVQCCDGVAALPDERLHVMQRMAFMDEECLANYRVGGMEFRDIETFDKWISEPQNRDRILPFPRTLIALRVRRNTKERDWYGDLKTILAQLRDSQADKATFLYIRNGDQVWRIQTELDLPEMIFPDPSVFNPSEPKYFQLFGNSVRQFKSKDDFDDLNARYVATKAKYDKWDHENPGAGWIDNPHRGYNHSSFEPRGWYPLDPSSVYYDDAMEKLAEHVKKYNRIALIIQGLFDRSMVLHPHPRVRTWTVDGFERAVKLVYDATGVIHHGTPPDFESYRKRCNASMGVGSTVVGQDRAWMLKEAEKENRRLEADWRNRSDYRPVLYRPQGNPGPGYIAKVLRFSRAKGATFVWMRERLTGREYGRQDIKSTVTVPLGQLFNIDAYRPGDFKMFFNDPRTREAYLKWAPLLIAAEEHHASLATSPG